MLSKNLILGRARILASYHDVFGVYGALAFLSHELAGYPREISAPVKGMPDRLCIRVGTSDAWLCRQVLLYGQYDQELPFIPKTIVDAGANIGLASIYYARRYPQARIIAIEAEASNFAILLRNVSHYPNIVPVRAALWKQDGFVSVRPPAAGLSEPWGFFTQEGAEGAQVRAVTMQTLMREFNIDFIDLFKIDIEGAERELFEGCDWADKVQAFAVELHDDVKPGCSTAVDAVTSDFSRSQHGEITFYLRS